MDKEVIIDIENPKDNDLISRQAVLDMLEDINAETEGVGFYYEHYVDYIKSLPSVKPLKPTGHWIDYDCNEDKYNKIKCSECGHSYIVDSYHWCDIGFTEDDLKYCPNCGVKMD